MIRNIASVCVLGLCSLAYAQGSQPSLTGTYVLTEDFFGTPRLMKLQLEQQGNKVTGSLANGDKYEGTVEGKTLHLTSRNKENDTFDVKATADGQTLNGTMVAIEAAHPEHPYTFTFTGKLLATPASRAPKTHEFTPTVFYRQFSALNKPVLTILPGDTIHTTTVDAGGTDEKSIRRSAGGNPQTGPFYIEGAMPGDVLAVHIKKLKLNRDWAVSDDQMDERAMNSDLAVKMKDNHSEVRWHLDLAKGVAMPEKPGPHMANFTIPLKPMLGCVATAVNISGAAPPTGDSGYFGGNMDFNEITEGATVYLRVANPGGLLYFGDGHAAQGDGELNGNALETSMDVEVTVDVLHNKQIGDPVVETPEAIITMGLDGSLDEAFKEATGDMANWLANNYKLTASEIAQVLGVSAEYHVSEAADRNAGLVLKIKKAYLQKLSEQPK